MLYYWKEPKPMNIADDPPMAQFKLKTWEANTTVTSHTNRKIESGYRTDSIAYIRCPKSSLALRNNQSHKKHMLGCVSSPPDSRNLALSFYTQVLL